MTLQPGSKFGPYEILDPIGAGGMGEIYRGRDTRLDRIVAIKILPAHLAEQPELRERFEREARAVAALNHPNVCVLFDVGEQDGIHFLVMEYLDGETLAARLTRGPIPLDQALKYAGEIADAFDKAHRQGVVHRDLKPGNVILTKSGSKLLDFGLARLKQSQSAAFSSSSIMPTKASALTAQGAIIGTLQYMSPEQLEGAETDARTDIFAFGAVLYEMVTGRKAFEGKSQVSLIGSILEREPAPMTTILSGIPAALDQLVRRCLAKDPDQRWQTAADVAAQIRWIASSSATQVISNPETIAARTSHAAGSRHANKIWIGAALLFFLVSIALIAAILYRPRDPVQAMRFQIPPPPQQTFVSALNPQSSYAGGSISPNGRRIAFTASDTSGNIRLWIRPIDSVTAQVLPGTEGAGLPFWSPDSQFVGFGAQGKLKKIDVAGGQPQVLCDATSFRGGAWNSDGVIVFAPTATSGLFRVPSSGGEPVQLTSVAAPQTSHRFPVFLPDNRRFIYSAVRTVQDHEIFVASLDKPGSTALLKAQTPALYSAGHLLFAREGSLFAQAFDVKSLKLSGEPIRVVEQVAAENNALAASVANMGTLIYRNGAIATGNVQLQWFERSGKPGELVGSPGEFVGIELSRNGTRIAVHRHDAAGGDVWVFDSAQGPMSRLTFDAAQDNASPIWSPDGSSIAYVSLRSGKHGIYKRSASGTGSEEVLVEPSDDFPVPMNWSPDGKFLVYTTRGKSTQEDIWTLPLTGDRKPVPLVVAPRNQALPQISPDGKWMAYISDESGRVELYVKTFPTGEGRWQITTNGASNLSVRWRGDGKELFYIVPGQTRELMAIPVTPEGSTFRWGTPEKLFDSGYIGIPHAGGGSYLDYAVSPNGQRFLIPRSDVPLVEAGILPINVIINWTGLLK